MAGPVGLVILGIEGCLIEEVIARHPVGSHGGRGEGIGLLNDILEDIIHFRGQLGGIVRIVGMRVHGRTSGNSHGIQLRFRR